MGGVKVGVHASRLAAFRSREQTAKLARMPWNSACVRSSPRVARNLPGVVGPRREYLACARRTEMNQRSLCAAPLNPGPCTDRISVDRSGGRSCQPTCPCFFFPKKGSLPKLSFGKIFPKLWSSPAAHRTCHANFRRPLQPRTLQLGSGAAISAP